MNINPTQIAFLTTNTCTASCDHCSLNASPKRRGKLSASQIRTVVSQLTDFEAMKVVVFTGGEPTLLGRDLLDSIAEVDSAGYCSRIVTNAHWATSDNAALSMLTSLREAGLRELNLSVDDYHLPYIPIERVVRAFRLAQGLGFDAVVLACAIGPKSQLTADVIEALLPRKMQRAYAEDGAKTHWESDVDGTIYLLSNAKLQRIGKAASLLGEDDVQIASERELSARCRWISDSPAVSPNFHLLACCGVEASRKQHLDYGDLGSETMKALLARAEDDVLMNALSDVGPYRLLKFLQEIDAQESPNQRFATMCEACDYLFSQRRVVESMQRNISSIAELVLSKAKQNVGKAEYQEVVAVDQTA